MSVYTSSVSSNRSSKAQPVRKKKAQAQASGGSKQPPSTGDSVHLSQKRKNGIWVTTERLPAKAGGLGEVSKTIPDAIAKYTDKDLRIIVPYEKANAEDDKKKRESGKENEAFHSTNLTLTVQPNNGEAPIVFEVMQKFEPAINADPHSERPQGNWVYALKSPFFLAEDDKSTGTKKDEGLSQFTYTGADQKAFHKVMVFNQAAGQLIPYLKEKGPAVTAPLQKGQEELHRFPGPVDFVIGNDWLSGPTLFQPDVQADSHSKKIFMVHNTYDQAQGAGVAEHFGIPIPSHINKVTDTYSPLELSLRSADVIIGNRNFVKTITETPFKRGNQFVEILKEHAAKGRIFDMHHGLAEDFTPARNEALREHREPTESLPGYQFEELQEDTPDGWAQFKTANKVALQAKYGLNHDPDAVLVSWAARLDPYQKGFYMVQNTLRELLDKNPKLQIIVAGNTSDPSVTAWIQRMNEDERYRGRFYMPNAFINKPAITQLNAGSDFVMLPSLYEPYGLTQLEAMKMGAIPIVHGVDGIRTTVSDPLVNGRDFIGRSKTGRGDPSCDEAAWFDPDTRKEWQTGILMRPMNENVKYKRAIDVSGYQAALDYEIALRTLELHVSKDHPVYPESGTPDKEREAFEGQAKHLSNLLGKVLEANEKRVEEGKKPVFPEPAEIEQLTSLRERLDGLAPSITLEDKKKIFDGIIRPRIIDTATKPAENSFMDAIQRAVGMDPDTRARVRDNAKRYVDHSHTWQEIVKRYNAAIDSTDPFKADPLTFHKPSFTLARPEESDDITPPQQPASKPKPGDKKPGFSPENIAPRKPKGFFQQVVDWVLFLINPMAWWRTLRLIFS